MIANAPVRELLTKGQLLQIKVANPGQALSILENISWVNSVKIEDEYLIVDVPKESASEVNKTLAEHGIFASELVSSNVSLESVFLQLTGGESGD